MLDWLNGLLRPPEFVDEDEAHTARLLNAILLSIVVFAVLYTILAPLIYENPGPVLASAALAVTACLIALSLIRRRRVRLAAALFLLALWLAATLSTAAYGGVGAAASGTYITLIFAAGLLLGARAGFVFVLISMLASLGLLVAEIQGLLPQPEAGSRLLLQWIGLTTNLVLAALLLYLATRSLIDALGRARRNEQDLMTINQALEKEIAERRRAEETLQEREAWLRAIVEGTHALLVQVDTRGRFVYVNDAVARLVGSSAEEMLGDLYLRYVHPEDRKRVGRVYQEQIQTGEEPTSLEFRILGVEGRVRWVNFVADPLWKDGEVVGQMGVALDITERVQSAAALRRREAELQARNEELDAFSHTVAHNLQSAAGLIIGYADIIVDDYELMSIEELKNALQFIAQSGRKMVNIIDELLLLAEVRKMEVQVEPLDMASIVAEAQRRLVYLIQERGAEIVMPDAWPEAMGYEPWIEEVWVNYVSNALKYGGEPPCIEMGAWPQPDGMVRFWIRDNGPGLTPEQRARLFTPFTKLSQARTKGHGLGLSIVRRIVEKLGGEVGVESSSRPDEGSLFTFTLPGSAQEAGTAAAESNSGTAISSSGGGR